jgi:hypothetical protein
MTWEEELDDDRERQRRLRQARTLTDDLDEAYTWYVRKQMELCEPILTAVLICTGVVMTGMALVLMALCCFWVMG